MNAVLDRRYELEQLIRLREEQVRRVTRGSLLRFATQAVGRMETGLVPQFHHKVLIQELQNLIDGENDRLLVHLPPGSAKSTYGSKIFPAWALAQKSNWNVIGAANTGLLSDGFSRNTMQIIRDNQDTLGFSLTKETAELWTTSNGGQYRSAGIGAVITGLRADLVIIDDPVRSHEESMSENFREKQWNWYTSDLRSRMKPNAKVVIIMTRWHEDDLGGRMMARQPGRWRVLSIPAVAVANDPLGRAPGEWLWDNDPNYSYGTDLRAVRLEHETQGSMRIWGALYQQDPRPAEGAMFNIYRVNALPVKPTAGRWVRAWDIAASKQIGGNDPDWTVGVLMGVVNHRFIIADVVRLRGGADEVRAAIINTAAKDGKTVQISIPQDPGAAGKNWATDIVSVALVGFSATMSLESGEKATRAAPFAAQVNVSNVDILSDKDEAGHLITFPWNAVLLDELSGFPGAAKDDQVDACSRAFNFLNEKPRGMKINRASLARM